jgi:lipopolysaccharide biosynthesis regulator YciM
MSRLTRAFRGGAHAGKDVDSLLRAALLATLDRDLDAAEESLARAIRLDSSGIEPFLALARLYRMRGEVGRAIRIHQNLLLRTDLGVHRTPVLIDLAIDYRQGGFLRRAIATYEEVVTRDPKNPDALRSLVRLLAEIREFPRAIELAGRLARIERDKTGAAEAELFVAMAETARAEGRIDDGRKAAKQALKRNRSFVRAWIVLGEIEAERGRNKAALAAWRRVPEIDASAGPRVYPQIEAAATALGKPAEFEKILRGVLVKEPNDVGATLALAQTFTARGEVDAAAAELRRLAESDPDALSARVALARLLLAEERVAEIGPVLTEILDAIDRMGAPHSREELE